MLRTVDFQLTEGPVSFRSMHAAAAVLFAYSVRNITFVFPVSIVVTIAMTMFALYGGAHYLADILAGLLPLGCAIGLARMTSQPAASKRTLISSAS